MQNIYNCSTILILKIKPNIIWKLMLACTTQVCFHGNVENICTQIDDVNMGSALGSSSSNYYIAHNKFFNG